MEKLHKENMYAGFAVFAVTLGVIGVSALLARPVRWLFWVGPGAYFLFSLFGFWKTATDYADTYRWAPDKAVKTFNSNSRGLVHVNLMFLVISLILLIVVVYTK